jgi:hypothetical protein
MEGLRIGNGIRLDVSQEWTFLYISNPIKAQN